jgi:thioredoxin-dependent peroxiredoxin
MKLRTHEPAPAFKVRDFRGNLINLSTYRDRNVYLAFERNARCPVCNLRVHTLLGQAAKFAGDATVILVYESTTEKMKEYLGDKEYPFHFVCDPDRRLYNLYAVERSWSKLMRSMFNGILKKVAAGNKLFDKPMSQDGHAHSIPAEFIIDGRGRLAVARYGRFVGDHIPVSELLKMLASTQVTNIA